jgi:hypothetical protein
MRSVSLSVVLLFIHCAPRNIDITQLKQSFAKPEYMASGDGWAEARRRSLLKDFLRVNAIPFHEIQQAKPGAPGDKYKRVTIAVPGLGENAGDDFPVTLALVPDQADQWRATGGQRQQQCDALLFTALERLPALRQRHPRILLTMDRLCHVEGLTARLDAVK